MSESNDKNNASDKEFILISCAKLKKRHKHESDHQSKCTNDKIIEADWRRLENKISWRSDFDRKSIIRRMIQSIGFRKSKI